MSFHTRLSRNRAYSQAAFSLAEMLITLGLFSALLTIVGQFALGAFRFQTDNVATQDSVRQGALACDLWSRDLRHCEAIVWPKYTDWSKGRVYKFPAGSNAVVVYRLRWGKEASTSLVGYRYWVKTGRLERCVFSSKQTMSAAALLKENAPLARKQLLPAASNLSVWSCNQAQCGGQAVLGFSFYSKSADSAQKGSRSQMGLGMQYSSEIHAKGM